MFFGYFVVSYCIRFKSSKQLKRKNSKNYQAIKHLLNNFHVKQINLKVNYTTYTTCENHMKAFWNTKLSQKF